MFCHHDGNSALVMCESGQQLWIEHPVQVFNKLSDSEKSGPVKKPVLNSGTRFCWKLVGHSFSPSWRPDVMTFGRIIWSCNRGVHLSRISPCQKWLIKTLLNNKKSFQLDLFRDISVCSLIVLPRCYTSAHQSWTNLGTTNCLRLVLHKSPIPIFFRGSKW